MVWVLCSLLDVSAFFYDLLLLWIVFLQACCGLSLICGFGVDCDDFGMWNLGDFGVCFSGVLHFRG